MKALTCAATRRRLDAYHDRELAAADQIAVEAHLDWCGDCAATVAGMRSAGAALRALAPGRAVLSSEEATGFGIAVVSRLAAERELSMGASIRAMFDDHRLVYVGLSAVVAATVSLALIVGMMRFGTDYRPDSLAAILHLMATPFECNHTSEVPAAVACRARWVERFQRAKESAEQDAVFTLAAIVTHNGRVANLSVLRASRHDAIGQAEVIEELLDAVSRARSAPQPTELSGEMVRMVATETVRAAKPRALDVTLPPAKRVTSAGDRPLAPQGGRGQRLTADASTWPLATLVSESMARTVRPRWLSMPSTESS